MKHCYAVLFDNGVCKFGYATDVRSRLADHTRAGSVFGFSVSLYVITEKTDEFLSMENKILETASRKFKKVSDEYFSEMTVDDVRDVMTSTKLFCFPTKVIPKNMTEGVSVFVSIENKSKANKSRICAINEKITGILKRNKSGGLSSGVLANRLRTYSASEITGAIEYLEGVGAIKIDVYEHPVNGSKITKIYTS